MSPGEEERLAQLALIASARVHDERADELVEVARGAIGRGQWEVGRTLTEAALRHRRYAVVVLDMLRAVGR